MPRPNTKPMTREEKIALYQMLHGEQGLLKTINTNTDEVKIAEKMKELYFGDKNEYEEKLPTKILSELPSDKIKDSFLNNFRKRSCPAYLGMLAEIDKNPEISLDELNDITSEKALASKAEAKKTLAEKLPHKDRNGNWVFDYNEFVKFVNKNTSKLREKLLKVIEQGQDSMSIYDKANLVTKYGIQINGLFDGYNQQFLSGDALLPEVSNSEEVTANYVKNQGVTSVMKQARNIVDQNIATIKFPVDDWDKQIDKDPIQIIFGGQPYPARKALATMVDTTSVEDMVMVSNKAQGVGAPVVDHFFNGRGGNLSNLTAFEQMLLGTDPQLSNMLSAEGYNFDGNMPTAAKVAFTDGNGKTYDLQMGTDPNQSDWRTLTKLKTELYKAMTSERYASNLLPEDVANMKEYLELTTDAQKLAHLQCSDFRNKLTKVTDELKKDLATDELPDFNYYKFIKPVTDLNNCVNELITNPNEANYHRLKKQMEVANAAIAEYKDYLANHQDAPAEHSNYIKTLETAISEYQASYDKLPTVIKDEIIAEKLATGENIVAKNKESAMAKVLKNIEPMDEVLNKVKFRDNIDPTQVQVARNIPEGLTDEVYTAIMIGAFLSEGVVDVAKLEGAEGEFKTEKVWNSVLNNLLLKGKDDNLKNADEVIELARVIGEQAVEDYLNGNKAGAVELIKNYTNAAVRLQDKNIALDGLNDEAVLNREMLKTAKEVEKVDDFKNVTGLKNVTRLKSNIRENIKEYTDFGYNASLDILSNNAKIVENGYSVVRKNAVLGVLTNMYLRMHAKAEKNELEAKATSVIVDAAAKRGIKLSPELINDKNLGDLSSALLKLHEATYIDSLEANFVTETSSHNFINNIRYRLEKTRLYDLLMKNDKALEEIAIKGEGATLLSPAHIKSLMDIKYIRTSADVDNTAIDAAIEEEYERQVDAIWDRYAGKLALKQNLLDIAKSEISSRPALNNARPLFYQNADRIAALYTSKKDELVAQGLDGKLVDELVTKIEAYKKLADEVYDTSNPSADKMRLNERQMASSLDEIAAAYSNINQEIKVELADGLPALVASDKKIVTAALELGENNIDVKSLVSDAVKDYQDNKLVSQFEDVVSREFLANDAKALVASMVEELKNAPADENAVEEFNKVVKATEYLHNVINKISQEGQPEIVSGASLAKYKEALENLSDKIGKYNDATVYNASSDRKLVVDYINDRTITSLIRVNEAASIQKSIETKANETIPFEDKVIKGLIARGQKYKSELERKGSNFANVFDGQPKSDIEGWAKSFNERFLKAENNYDASKLQGYTAKEVALIASLITFSHSFHNLEENVFANSLGTGHSDVFGERTEASGDKAFGDFIENTRPKMNQFLDEMNRGNWENVSKYIIEGYRMLGTRSGEISFTLTNLTSISSYIPVKEIQDMIDKHSELKAIIDSSDKIKENGKEVDKPRIPEWVKNQYKSIQKVVPIAFVYADAKRRVADYIEQNLGKNVELVAGSQIAKDFQTVIAYERLSCEASFERFKNDAVYTDEFITKGATFADKITRLRQEKKNNNKKLELIEKYRLEERSMSELTDEEYSEAKSVLDVVQAHDNVKLSKEEVAALKQKLISRNEKIDPEIEEMSEYAPENLALISVKHDIFPDKLKNLSQEEFEEKVKAEEAVLFGNAQKKTYSSNEIACLGLNDDNAIFHNMIDLINRTPKYRDSSLVRVREDISEIVNVFKQSVGNKMTNDAIDKYLEKVDYYVERVKRLQQPLKDGSYISVNKELHDSILKSYNDIIKMTNEAKKEFEKACSKVGSDSHVYKSYGSNFDSIANAINRSVEADKAALTKGTLYGLTEIHNVKEQIASITGIGHNLAKSRAWGDGSSPEFKELLNNIAKINDVSTDKRTDSGIKAYVETLQKIYDSAKEYARYKEFNNNGSSRSTLRINEVNKLIEYLDGILPVVKTEASENSLENRFKSLSFNKEKIASSEKIFESFDKKRSELGKLEDEPYRKMSERALTAREKLMEYYIKGMPKDGYAKGTKEYNEIKKCLAEIILEKRFEYERDVIEGITVADTEARSTKPIFYSRLLSRDENDEVFVPGDYQVKLELDKDSIVNQEEDNMDELLEDIDEEFEDGLDLFGEADEVEDEMDAAEKKATEENLINTQAHKENVYDNMVDQVMNYNFINDDDLKPENIFKILTDESGEVANLYQKSLRNALESKKLADMAKERAAAELEQKAKQANNANNIRL